MDTDVKNDFSRGSVGKHIARQAVPLTIAQLVQLIYNVVDRVYIGHLPEIGGQALTGVGIVFPIVTMIAAFTNLFSMGGAPLFSIARGAGQTERASKIMNQTFVLLTITALTLMTVGYGFQRPILRIFGASEATCQYAGEYLSLYLAGTLFLVLGTGMNQFIMAQGFPRMGMTVVLSGAVMNIALDPLFIYTFGLGVRGAAVATVLSQFFTFLLVLGFFRGRRTLFRLKRRDMKLEMPQIMKIAGLGMSGFIMAVTNSLVQIICNRTLKIYGGDLYIGVMTILNQVREIANLIVVGITSGAQPVLGFNYGAGEYKRVKRAIVLTSVSGVLYTTLFWLAVMLQPEPFVRMFNDSEALVRPAAAAIRLYFFGFFFMSFQFAGQSTFVALGKAKKSVFFSLLRKVFIVVPLTILLPHIHGLGVDGVFLAEPISNAVGGVACFTTMIVTVWGELKEKE